MPTAPLSASLAQQLTEFVAHLASGDGEAIAAAQKGLEATFAQQGVSPEQASALGQQLMGQFLSGLDRGDSPTEAAQGVSQGAEQVVETVRTTTGNTGATGAASNALEVALASGAGLDALASGGGGTSGSGDGDAAIFYAALVEALQSGKKIDAAVQTARKQQEAVKEAAAQQEAAAGESAPVDSQSVEALVAGMSAEQAALFLEAYQNALSQGLDPRAALTLAGQFVERHVESQTAQNVALTPAERLAAALAGGLDSGEALREAGLGHAASDPTAAQGFMAALAVGANPLQAGQLAQQIQSASEQLQARQSVPLSAADQLAMALANGIQAQGALDALLPAGGQGNQAFLAALTQSLGSGGSMGSALQSAQSASNTAVSNAQQSAVPVSPADQLMTALASGENAAQVLAEATKSDPGGGAAFLQGLTQALSQGSDAASALNEAQQAAASQTETAAASAVPVSPEQQVLMAMADPSLATSEAFKEQVNSGDPTLTQVANAASPGAQTTTTAVAPPAATTQPATAEASQPPAATPAETPAVTPTQPQTPAVTAAVTATPPAATTPVATPVATVPTAVESVVVATLPTVVVPVTPVVTTPASTQTVATVVVIPPANTAPIITLPGGQNGLEDEVLTILGILVNDAEANTLDVTLRAEQGVLTLAQSTGLTFSQGDGQGDAVLQFSGSKTEINAALSQVSYLGSSDYFGADRLELVLSDLGGSGTGGILTTSSGVDLVLQAVNDAPVVTVGATMLAYAEGSEAMAIDGTITVSDVDDTLLIGATVVIDSGYTSGDQLSFVSQNGITGLFDAGTLTLSGDATPEHYQIALRSVLFGSVSDNPALESVTRSIVWTLLDGDDLSLEGRSVVQVASVNDAPVFTSTTTGSVSENAATSTVVYTATATDVDSGDSQIYSLGGTDASLFSIDAATGVVTLKAAADYESQSSYAINVIVTDSGGLTDTQAVTIGVVDVNEAPTITSVNSGSVSENAATSTVVYTATATDVDSGDS
ncbi:MAG: cadherin domain-containing protein, partial [Magnetococcales bacterium]|nr:cadherin domain-containing protein [Magnetococcales bacterium]